MLVAVYCITEMAFGCGFLVQHLNEFYYFPIVWLLMHNGMKFFWILVMLFIGKKNKQIYFILQGL
jgi:hypothetical protein